MRLRTRLRVVVAEAPPDKQVHDAFSIDPMIEIVGVAASGLEAVEMVRSLRPDAVVIDARISRMNGLDATRQIMSETPTPIIMVADDGDHTAIKMSMGAQLAGALATVPRPARTGNSEFAARSTALVDAVRTMAGLKLVRHWQVPHRSFDVVAPAGPRRFLRPSVVAIGASTGGPAAIYCILSELTPSFAIPILVTQHIAEGFIGGLVRWLDEATPLNIKIGEHGEPLRPGVVYVAGDRRHMTVARDRTIALTHTDAVDGHCPSATVLFNSVADTYGSRAVAVILTGMGNDGVKGLGAVRSAGGRIVAQDRETCAVFGMPQAAIAAGFADIVLPIEKIASELISVLSERWE